MQWTKLVSCAALECRNKRSGDGSIGCEWRCRKRTARYMRSRRHQPGFCEETTHRKRPSGRIQSSRARAGPAAEEGHRALRQGLQRRLRLCRRDGLRTVRRQAERVGEVGVCDRRAEARVGPEAGAQVREGHAPR